MIEVNDLTKDYSVYRKDAGFIGSLKSLFNRDYETVRAIQDLSFSIKKGEMVGLLGANGSGKTTTLKMLSGLLYPTSGHVEVAGCMPKRRERHFLSKITLVMGQKTQLNWDLSPADSFLLYQAIYDIPDRQFKRNVAELTEMLELGDLVNRQVRKLSLGERLKCELAASLLHSPTVMFLDEPTIGLDIHIQQSIHKFVRAYNSANQATVILTSHNMIDMTALADRVLVIENGQIIFDGQFSQLAAQFAPYKIVKLRLEREVPASDFARFGEVRRLSKGSGELLVERSSVRASASRVLADFPVADISIEDIPLEDVVGQLFRSGVNGPELRAC